MTIQHEFFIHRLYTMPQVGELQNVIAKVEWRALLTRNGVKSVAAVETLLDLTTLSAETFMPITDLTAATVIEWAVQAEGGDAFIAHLKEIHEPILSRKERELGFTAWDIPLVEPKRWDDTYAR